MRIAKLLTYLIIVGAAISFFGLRAFLLSTRVEPPVTTHATIGDVSSMVLASGMLEAKELVSVGAGVSGQIETLYVSLGQQVEEGDLIAQIDSQNQQNAVQVALAQLAGIDAEIAATRAELKRAQLAYQRYSDLGERQYSSAEEIEKAATEVQIYQANLDGLSADKIAAGITLSTERLALKRTRITAPISGTVVAIVMKQGQTVNANTNAPTIVKLADLSTMLVKTEISEVDVMSVAPGQKASFSTLGSSGRLFDAVLREIEPAPRQIVESDTIDPESAVYYNGLLAVENPDRALRIGMTAQVMIQLAEVKDVLIVPSSALRGNFDDRYVMVFDSERGTTSRREVEIGLDNNVNAQIISGLKEGEEIIIGTTAAAYVRNPVVE